MAEGSRGHHRIASSKDLQPVPKDYGGKQITSYDSRVRQGEQSSFHQKTSRTSYVDKQTGKYTRATTKEVVSTGETFKERSTGRVGYKEEYKASSTCRIGDKGGYTEHHLEERVRRVDYGGSGSNKKGDYSAGSYNGGGPIISYEESDGDEEGEDYEESDGDEEGEDYEESDGDEGGEDYEESDGDEGGEAYSDYGDSDGYDDHESNYYSDSD